MYVMYVELRIEAMRIEADRVSPPTEPVRPLRHSAPRAGLLRRLDAHRASGPALLPGARRRPAPGLRVAPRGPPGPSPPRDAAGRVRLPRVLPRQRPLLRRPLDEEFEADDEDEDAVKAKVLRFPY